MADVLMFEPMAGVVFQGHHLFDGQAGFKHEMGRQRVFGRAHGPHVYMVHVLHTLHRP